MIEVATVSKRYGRTLALDAVSLEVEDGELFALLGPNGAGKTTLINILCTLQPPDTGRVRVAGRDVVRQPRRARAQIGVVFQDSSLDTRLTVFENLDFHGMVYGVPRALRRKRIDELLDLVELSRWREQLVRQLSSGMKRRLELARALVHDSRLLVLDEPTVGLDAQTRERLWAYVRRLQGERELTVLVTTHYLEEVETCDRVCIIDSGKVLALGTPEGLRAVHAQEVMQVGLRDERVAADVAAHYPERLLSQAGDTLTLTAGDAFTERFLTSYGTQVRTLHITRPSLEQVFLALTGRDLRDEGAGQREITYDFGKRGGEHTG